MNYILRFFALLIVGLGILLLPLMLLGRAAGDVVFSPETLLTLVAENALDDDTIQEVLKTTVIQKLDDESIPPDSELGKIVAYAVDFPQLRQTILPRELLVELARQTIINGFTWLDGPEVYPNFSYNFGQIKTHISSNGPEIVEATLNVLPSCTAEETLGLAAQLLGSLLGGGETAVTIPVCIPDQLPREPLIEFVGGVINEQASLLPENGTINPATNLSEASITRLKASLRLAQVVSRWGWVAPLTLLLVGVMLGYASGQSAFRWAGWSLLSAGLLTALISLAVYYFTPFMVESAARGAPALFYSPVKATVGAGIELMKRPLLWETAVQIVLGIVALIVSAGRK